ncbi:MAG: hypothetical protein U0359_33690, partial [Byssovorax sp.]
MLVLLGIGAFFGWIVSAIAGAFGPGKRVLSLEGEHLALRQSLEEVQHRLVRAEAAIAEQRREVFALRREAADRRGTYAAPVSEVRLPVVEPVRAPEPVRVPVVPIWEEPVPVQAAALVEHVEEVRAARVQEQPVPAPSPLPLPLPIP